jgi:Rrf2 family protein
MKLTTAASYALHAVAYMAAQKVTDKPVASHKIAQERGIPERFLLKVLKPLVSARVLRSTKGPNGGYHLAKPASDITMLEIVEAVDGTIRGHAPPTRENNGALNAKLERICNKGAEQMREYLGSVRVPDLVSGKK